jgi:hypothetical protein
MRPKIKWWLFSGIAWGIVDAVAYVIFMGLSIIGLKPLFGMPVWLMLVICQPVLFLTYRRLVNEKVWEDELMA